jgi:TonB family protein
MANCVKPTTVLVRYRREWHEHICSGSASRKSPADRTRWGSLAASYAVQITATVALLTYTIFAPKIEPALARHIELVAPELNTPPAKVAKVKPLRTIAKLQPQQIAIPVPAKIQQPPPLQVQQPQRVRRAAPVEEVAQPQLAPAPKFDSKLLNTLPNPKAISKIVATNTFSGSSAPPTLEKTAPSKVQTGGFGDPNGVAVNAHGGNKSNIAAVGSFDLPNGSGNGNGTGGAAGARGSVASAGFGNTVAVQAGQRSQPHIQPTGFAAAPVPEEHHAKVVQDSSNSIPVSIQSKPTPVYTAEARQLRVEGEVLLSVVFAADGQIRILSVVHGLGHGLDQAAQRAAQGVKFIPAKRNGHPVDSNATLHIVFQLS